MFKNFKQQFKNKNTNERIDYVFIIGSIVLILVFALQFVLYWFLVNPNNPLNVPLFFQNYADAFMDFFNVNSFLSENNPYRSGDSSYPPLVLLIAKFFSIFADYKSTDYVQGARNARESAGGIISLILYFLIIIVSLFFLLRKYLKDKNVSTKNIILISVVFLFSAPVIFVFQRGNYLMLSLLFSAIFFVFRKDENKILRELSYISLAAAVGIKLYPAIFAVVFLREKNVPALIRTALYSTVFLFLPFVFFKGGFSNVPAFINNLLDFSKATISTIATEDGIEYYFSPSPSRNFSVINMVTVCFQLILKFNFGDTPGWVSIMASCAMIIFGAALVFTALFSGKQWKVAAACALTTTIIPNPSYVYTAVFMLIPCAAFLVDKSKTKKDWLYMVLFLIILTPVQFGFIIKPGSYRLVFGITAANFIQGMVLLIFTVMLTVDAIKDLRLKSGRKIKHQN